MRAIELYPYWDDNRALLDELIAPLTDADLAFSPSHGLPSLGAVLRHIITTEEHWWYGGILGKPYAEWRPEGWERFTGEQKEACRVRRFPTGTSIRAGLIQAHAPVAAFLRELDAWALCEKRRAIDDDRPWDPEDALWHISMHELGRRLRERFATVESLVRVLEEVHRATRPAGVRRLCLTLLFPAAYNGAGLDPLFLRPNARGAAEGESCWVRVSVSV